MFSVKIMLKQCQKTTVTSEYVSNVVTTVDGAGEKTMKFCLQVAETNLLLSKPWFDTEHINSKSCDKTCHKNTPQDSKEFPDILSTYGQTSPIKDHHFLKKLKEFLDKHKAALSLPNDISKSFRDTRSQQNTISMLND